MGKIRKIMRTKTNQKNGAKSAIKFSKSPKKQTFPALNISTIV